jgi:hypothetical protein
MKKLAILSIVLLMTGCATTPVAVKMNNPYDFPPALLEDCKDPEMLIPDAKLSDNVKKMVDNNVKAAECRITKRALTEMILKRKEIFDKNQK